MQNPKRQQGLTFITILIILALIAFFTLLTLKIAPIYINHGRVKNAMAAVEQMPDIETLSAREILSSFEKRFDINYVEHVTKDNIAIATQGNYVKVEIDYEVVVPLCCHLSALAQFHEEFEKGEK
jgi:Tfp pilus assembly protein PilE